MRKPSGTPWPWRHLCTSIVNSQLAINPHAPAVVRQQPKIKEPASRRDISEAKGPVTDCSTQAALNLTH